MRISRLEDLCYCHCQKTMHHRLHLRLITGISCNSIVSNRIIGYPPAFTSSSRNRTYLPYRCFSLSTSTMSSTNPNPRKITVSPPPASQVNRSPQPHWANTTTPIPTLFKNPWPSFRSPRLSDVATMIYNVNFKPSPGGPLTSVSECAKNIPTRRPDFLVGETALPASQKEIKVTWLGHACFILELPLSPSNPGATRGIRLLLDPVFSNRCSPSSYFGPARFTKPPCKVEELPEIDAVVISHNHYDREFYLPCGPS